MPKYSYRGFDSEGREDAGVIDARSEAIAFGLLQSRGITVVEIQNGNNQIGKQKPWYLRDIGLRSSLLPLEHQAIVAELLSSLFSAGLTAEEAVRVVMKSTDIPQVRRHFERTGHRLADGMQFGDAFDSGEPLFSPIFIAYVRVSDQANAMPGNLLDLAEFLRNQSAIREKILSALVYPVILVITAIFLLLFVILYLAPSLAPIFTSLDRQLPSTLSLMLSLNSSLRDYGYYVVLGLVSFSVVASTSISRLPVPWVVENVPILRRLHLNRTLSQFCRGTKLLLDSGMPLPQAMRTVAQMDGTGSRVGALFRTAATAIEAGGTASTKFSTAQYLPNTFRELFQVGEQNNRLPSVLGTLSDFYALQTDRQIARILLMLTPVLTLVIGAGIGFLIYTVMGAILEVNEVVF